MIIDKVELENCEDENFNGISYYSPTIFTQITARTIRNALLRIRLIILEHNKDIV